MSNLRQLYLATEMYPNKYRRLHDALHRRQGSARDFNWWGIYVLGTRSACGARQHRRRPARRRRSHREDDRLPGNEREKDPALSFWADFTYNGNLGDFRATTRSIGRQAHRLQAVGVL